MGALCIKFVEGRAHGLYSYGAGNVFVAAAGQASRTDRRSSGDTRHRAHEDTADTSIRVLAMSGTCFGAAPGREKAVLSRVPFPVRFHIPAPIMALALACGLVLAPAPALAQAEPQTQDSQAQTSQATPSAAPTVAVPQVAGPGLPTLSNADGNLAQRLITGSQATRCRPGRSADGAIVVCGGAEAREKERLPLRDQTDTAQSTNDGLPRAPNVFGMAPCKGNGACVGFGSVPPPMYYFDITALPPPPPGSDADRIAKGEIRAP